MDDIKVDFSISAADLTALSEQVISRWRAAEDEVAALDGATADYEAVCGRLARLDAELACDSSTCTFPQHMSTDKEVRDASSAADKAISEYGIESGMRKDVYETVKAYSDAAKAR